MVGVQRPRHGKHVGIKAISQHSSQTACEAGVRWTVENTPRLRARSKRCGNARSPAIRVNKHLCSPRALHLPHLYQGASLPVGSIAAAAGSSEPPANHRDHLAGVVSAGAVATGEAPSVLSPAEKVDHLFRIFDVDQDGLLSYSELRAFLSALAEKVWDDRFRFEEWCCLLKADSSLGLTSQDFGKLLSLERSFLDDSFRILGLESLGVKLLGPAAVQRAELLRRALDSNLAVMPLLTTCWCGDFQRLLASELLTAVSSAGGSTSGSRGMSPGIAPGSRGMSPVQMAMSAAELQEMLAMLLRALNGFVEAAASSADRWYNCFQGYLRRAALDRSVQEWAAFDATWGAKIATLLAQVRAAEALRKEVAESEGDVKPELIWRYVHVVLELIATLELSKTHGLVMPTVQIAAVESVARRMQGGSAQPVRSMEAGSAQPSRSPTRSPGLSTMRRPGRHNRHSGRPVRGWAGRPATSAPASPVDRPLKPISAASPVDRPVTVPATPVQQAPIRQALRDIVPVDSADAEDASQCKIQPPKTHPGRPGKRPLPTRQTPPSATNTAESTTVPLEAALADEADEVDDMSQAKPEEQEVNAGALQNDDADPDAAYDDDTYDDDDDDEALQPSGSSERSSADLQQHLSSNQEHGQSTSSPSHGESRDVVEPLPAERCGNNARDIHMADRTSLRSGTPASSATYEMDFDSEDGNAPAEVHSDDDAAAAENKDDEQQAQHIADDAAGASAGASVAASETDVDEPVLVGDTALLKAKIASEMQSISKDALQAPQGEDSNDSEEDDFLEHARRTAHREAALDADDAGAEVGAYEQAAPSADAAEAEPQPVCVDTEEKVQELTLQEEVQPAEPLQTEEKREEAFNTEPVMEESAIAEKALLALEAAFDEEESAVAEKALLALEAAMDEEENAIAEKAFLALEAAMDEEESAVAEKALLALEAAMDEEESAIAEKELPPLEAAMDEESAIAEKAFLALEAAMDEEESAIAEKALLALEAAMDEEESAVAEKELPPLEAAMDEESAIAEKAFLALEAAMDEEESTIAKKALLALEAAMDDEERAVAEKELPPVEAAMDEEEESAVAEQSLQPLEAAMDKESAIAEKAFLALEAAMDEEESAIAEKTLLALEPAMDKEESAVAEKALPPLEARTDEEENAVAEKAFLALEAAMDEEESAIAEKALLALEAAMDEEESAIAEKALLALEAAMDEEMDEAAIADHGDENSSTSSSESEGEVECITTTIPPRQEATPGEDARLEADAERQGSRPSSACGSSVWELDADLDWNATEMRTDRSVGFLHDCGADGSSPPYGMVYEAGEVSSMPHSSRESLTSAVASVAETMSLPAESAGSLAEQGSAASEAESRSSSDGLV